MVIIKHISIFLILVFIFSPLYLRAENKVVPILEGEKASFDGLLVPEERFVEFLKAENNAEFMEKQLEFKDFEIKLEQEYCDKKVNACLKELNGCREISKRKWYENPGFNRWLGVGVGVIITSLAVYGAGQLNE